MAQCLLYTVQRMTIKFSTLLLFIILVATAVHAQPMTADDYRMQQEQQRKNLLLQQMDSGIYLMDMGKYMLADAKFKYVLQHIKSVPSDLAFYFGKNSYFLEQYKQSIDWLNKYLQLKGTTGQFSDEATGYLRKAENDLVAKRHNELKNTQEVLSRNFDIDCGPTGKVYCPVCKGGHVIIKKGAFGNEYKTCPYCDEHGILTCEEYNALVRGELKPKF